MADGINLSLNIRAVSSIVAILLLIVQQQFPDNDYLNCDGLNLNSISKHQKNDYSIHETSPQLPGEENTLFQTSPKSDSMIATSKSFQFGDKNGGKAAESQIEQVPFSGPLPNMIKVFGAKSEGAFAVLTDVDDDSVRRAMNICYQLHKHKTIFDCLIVSPYHIESRLEAQIRAVNAIPVVMGEAAYPPKFNPKKASFKLCWHKLRLLLLSPYRAIVSLDSDMLVLNNVDFIVQKILNNEGTKVRWYAARDETPLCEDCNAFASGAPNAGVFGLQPNPSVYAKLIHRSLYWSPWFGFEWTYSEQELLSIYFLVEAEKNNVEMIWLDNGVNYFACKLRCPNVAPPSILHFVGVPKPSDLFPAASRRSSILNNFHPAFPEYGYIRNYYVTWFERYVGAMKLAKAHRPALLWEEHLMSNDQQALLWQPPNATSGSVASRSKNFLAYVDVPRTGGAAVIKMLMRSLYGEKWFYEECKSKRDNHPPLCATFGEWIRPKDRSREELTRCTVLGCGLGHLTLPRIKEAVGIELLKRTFTVIMLRHPVDLFVSEYYYIASEVLKSNPSLQFVQDPILREKMRKGMTLKQYTSYPHQHHDWHGASTNRQAFYLTGLAAGNLGAKNRDEAKARKVLLKAIVTLRTADFVGMMDDMGRTIRMMRCVLGIPTLEAPTPAVMKSVLGSPEQIQMRPTNDTDLIRTIEQLNRVDMDLHEFGSELFDIRWANLGVLQKSGYDSCR